MKQYANLLNELRGLMQQGGITVTEIEMTPGNYDEDHNLIEGRVPTLTTAFCEVGAYDDCCYFNVILESDLFSDELLDLILVSPNVQIYGLKNFLINYYPRENFTKAEFEKQINSEEYAQAQFIFGTTNLNAETLFNKYFEVQALFEKAMIKVENQLVKDYR